MLIQAGAVEQLEQKILDVSFNPVYFYSLLKLYTGINVYNHVAVYVPDKPTGIQSIYCIPLLVNMVHVLWFCSKRVKLQIWRTETTTACIVYKWRHN